MDKLLKASELAEILNVSKDWVMSHASGKRKPIIPSYKLGRSVRFDLAEVKAEITSWKQTE